LSPQTTTLTGSGSMSILLSPQTTTLTTIYTYYH
jgi:hypothetical protein